MSIDAGKLSAWREDIAGWAEENVHVQDPETGAIGPLVLQDHQRAWLRQATARDGNGQLKHRVAAACWPKREGKDLVCGLVIAHRMACSERQRGGIIANSERQSQSTLFDTVAGFFQDSPALRPYVEGPKALQGGKLAVAALGNTLEAFPANYRTIQGIQFDVVGCTELHASEDNGKAYTFASQQTEAAGAQVVIASQAGAPVQQNPMWRLHNAKEPHVFFDYRTSVATPWAIRLKAQAEGELLAGEFSYLWENAFGATGLKLLPSSEIAAAAMDYDMPTTQKEWEHLQELWGWRSKPRAQPRVWDQLRREETYYPPSPGTSGVVIGVGLDRAGVGVSGDRTVWVAVAAHTPKKKPQGDRPEPIFRVVMVEVLPTGAESEVMECDRKTRAIFGDPGALHFEYFGCSDLVEKVRRTELRNPTPSEQNTNFNFLARLFREGRFGFPEDAGEYRDRHGHLLTGLLKQELVAFEYDAQKAGLTRFGTQGGHDDSVYGTGLATSAAAEQIRRDGGIHQMPYVSDGPDFGPLGFGPDVG